MYLAAFVLKGSHVIRQASCLGRWRALGNLGARRDRLVCHNEPEPSQARLPEGEVLFYHFAGPQLDDSHAPAGLVDGIFPFLLFLLRCPVGHAHDDVRKSVSPVAAPRTISSPSANDRGVPAKVVAPPGTLARNR